MQLDSALPLLRCAGRMALGYIPEQLLHIRGTSRLLWLPLVSLAMSGACMALAYASLDGLYPLAVLSGFAFGGHWALFPSYASELFGLYHFASTYTLLQFAPATGSFGLAMGLAGWLYEVSCVQKALRWCALGVGCVPSSEWLSHVPL